ncbi:MAG: lamin tail domain-containing protein [Flavobacteriales bacterium]|nr:lamin tail domain-containing protein [Flavobacteriales bacterium]
MAAVASAQATDLIISQYLEGSSGNNKYLELYNGTASAINLTNYQLRLYPEWRWAGSQVQGPVKRFACLLERQ